MNARISQLRGYQSDYNDLSTLLDGLSDKTRHEIMVPMTGVAFQPGNETI